MLAAQAGNVPLAALSLFQGLTGGMDWGDMSGPMMEPSTSAPSRCRTCRAIRSTLLARHIKSSCMPCHT